MTNLILAIKIALLGLMNHEQVQMSCPMPNSTVIEQSGWSAQVNLSENNQTSGCPISIFIEHNGCLNSDYLSTLKPSDFYPNSTGQATLLVDDEMMPWPKTSSKLRKIPKIHNKKICGEKVTVIFNLTIPLNETRAKKTDTSDKTRYIVEKHIPRNERRKKERDSQKIKRKLME